MPKSLAEHLAEVRRAIPTREREARADEQAKSPAVVLDAVLPRQRPLSTEEERLVRFLVEHSTNKALEDQIDRITVYKQCTCGCPTVDFALDGEPTSAKGERIISDFYGEVEGEDVGVMLFEQGGRLSTLEVYSCVGSSRRFGLPKLDTLRAV